MAEYNLRIQKALNGWVVINFNQIIIAKDDEDLPGVIAAALVSQRLEDNSGRKAADIAPMQRYILPTPAGLQQSTAELLDKISATTEQLDRPPGKSTASALAKRLGRPW